MELGLFASIRWTQRMKDSSSVVIRFLSTIDEFLYSLGLGVLMDGVYIFDINKTFLHKCCIELNIVIDDKNAF